MSLCVYVCLWICMSVSLPFSVYAVWMNEPCKSNPNTQRIEMKTINKNEKINQKKGEEVDRKILYAEN